MKKRFGLIAALLAVTALVGCAKAPTEEDYKAWAEANGYVQNPNYEKWAGDNGYIKNPDYAGWAEENGYSKLEALPAARLSGKTGYTNAESGVQIKPSVEGQVALLDLLNRPDVRYVDLRDMQRGYLAGHIEGFESIDYFNVIANVNSKTALYNATSGDMTATFTPNYEESDTILEMLFPKGETLFLMCQGGARVVPFMRLLESKGYDMTKIYNVGGWGQVDTTKYPVSTSTEISATVAYVFSNKLTPYTGE